jgi:hypothetical protein
MLLMLRFDPAWLYYYVFLKTNAGEKQYAKTNSKEGPTFD